MIRNTQWKLDAELDRLEDVQIIYRQAVQDILAADLPSGSGFDTGWTFHWCANGKLEVCSSYHTMDEYGGYDGWCDFMLVFDPNELVGFRLNFIGRVSQNLALKYGLREYMEDTICNALNN